MRRIPALAAALLLSAGSASALTFFDLATGDEALLPDARSVALGRTRIVEDAGAFTAAGNPACLPSVRGLTGMLGGSVLKLKETRSTPAYDSFDGYLVESIYVLNDEYQFEGGIGAALGFEWGGRRWGAGLSLSPVRDFQYDYSEEVRDNNAFTQPRDALLAVNEVQSDGSVDAWSLGVGTHVIPELEVGATVQWLTGKHDFVSRTRFVQGDSTTFTRANISGLDGTRWIVGARWTPVPAVSASGVLRSRTRVTGDAREEASGVAASTGQADITYPVELSFGAAWRPRAKVRTTVRAEATWVQWTEYQNDLLADDALDDVWDARIGIEHVFYNNFPLRFGLRYAPAPLDDEVATTAFTFGGGVDAGRVRADLSFEVANRRYRHEDLFDDAVFGGETRVRTDLVEESGTSMFLTVGSTWAVLGG